MTSKDKEMEKELDKWLKGCPKVIKDIARKYPPWKTYVHKGHPDTATYTLHSINEDGTVTCNKIDFMGIPIQVFGINPDDLINADDQAKGTSTSRNLGVRVIEVPATYYLPFNKAKEAE